MQFGNLGVVERKTLGALLLLANEQNMVHATLREIADAMGYKEPGGAITFALRILERDNFVVRTNRKELKLLV